MGYRTILVEKTQAIATVTLNRPEARNALDLTMREELATALQQYLNLAANLLELEEGGVFRFFSKDELAGLFEGAGFDQVKVYESFGHPPQAFVAVGVKR